MVKYPLHLHLEKLADWQLRLFMICLCERMYPNFAFYCQQIDVPDAKVYKDILDLNWESLIVKKASINFDLQLEKLEKVMPIVNEQSSYAVYPALDACEALSELIHSYISGEERFEHAIKVGQISVKTVIELGAAQNGVDLTETEIKKYLPLVNELDIQWEIYDLVKNEKKPTAELVKGLKSELREDNSSNIGVFLSN